AEVVFSEEPGLTVPVVAATRINGRYFVFVAEAGEGGATIARQKPIGVGRVIGSDYVVTDGLQAGEQVIVGGIQKIGEGSPVTIVPASGGAPAAQDPSAGVGGQ